MPKGSRNVGSFTRAVASEFRAVLAITQTSQIQLSESTGIPYGTLSKILRGITPIDLEQFYIICEALKLDPPAVISSANATRARSLEVNLVEPTRK